MFLQFRREALGVNGGPFGNSVASMGKIKIRIRIKIKMILS
jgi:hypothetical protein